MVYKYKEFLYIMHLVSHVSCLPGRLFTIDTPGKAVLECHIDGIMQYVFYCVKFHWDSSCFIQSFFFYYWISSPLRIHLPVQETQGLIPWVRKISWSRKGQPDLISFPGKSQVTKSQMQLSTHRSQFKTPYWYWDEERIFMDFIKYRTRK